MCDCVVFVVCVCAVIVLSCLSRNDSGVIEGLG